MISLTRLYIIKFLGLIIIGISVSWNLNAQVPNNWFFGQKSAINFNGGTSVTFLNGSNMSTPEGCASYDKNNTTPLFYTNGEKVWSWQTGSIIANGNNLNGSMNSCQSSLFYMPSKSDTLYLFTTDAHNGNNGLSFHKFGQTSPGSYDLLYTNISLLPSSTERMTLTNHCDKKSMWLIVHQWNSNAFYSYKINEDSLEPSPVITNMGSVHSGNSLNAKGCMKVSSDGTKLALAKMSAGQVELFHFDNIHGTLSDPILLTGISNAYGVEFSSNGDILYISTVTGDIIQYSLSVWNASAIQNSKYTVSSQAQLLGSLQIGPDNMIYVAKDNDFYLGRIEIPGSMGASCTYNPTAIYLNGNKGEAGLPQVYTSENSWDFQVPIECLGDTSFFHILGDTTKLDSVQWYFGKTPILDSSTSFEPYFVYNQLGLFDVTLIIYHCDTLDTLESQSKIVGPPYANLGPDTSFCENSVKIIDGGGGEDYLWNDGSTNSSLTVTTPGIYWVKLSNSCGDSWDTIEVLNVFPTPFVSLPPDTNICDGDSLILTAGNDSSLTYVWQYYDTTQYFTVKNAATYFVEVIDTNNCKNSDYFSLAIDEFPSISLGPDTSLCIGFNLLFNGQSQGHYLWQDGSIDTAYTVSEPGIYYVSIRNACGEAFDTCEVFYDDCHQVIWVPNAFTPNADGKNDVFKPYIENVSEYHLYIMNRWGELIFETSNINEGWDGYNKGGKAPQDSYIWRIDYTNYDGDNFQKYGFIILYR